MSILGRPTKIPKAIHVRLAIECDKVSSVRNFRHVQRHSLGASAVAVLFIGACLIGICVCGVQAQSAITVFVTVTDTQGRYVTHLQKDDFEIFEDGQPQPLVSIDRETRALRIVVVLDRSASMNGAYPRLFEAVATFLTRLQPDDKLRVGAFSDRVEFSSRFTASPLELLADLSDLSFGNGTKLYDAVLASCDQLKGTDGRPVLVVATDGDDTDSRARRDAVVNRLRTANIATYVVGIHTKYFNGVQVVQNTPGRDLKTLPEDTGGAFFEAKDVRDTPSIFTRIAEELHSQYVLAFSPSQHDGRVHRLTIRVKPQSLTARANLNYIALKSE